ncbi:uncharacterized protein K489DRAFT_291321, partial [Dissoconium aciculare CBS 342.82]|uniref:Autophagy-related protein 14 n=1 Tax=Dissoconium aciculare CBS 342.82 TaxID=1314786 RepID=A0A6J3LUS2_9PEZI
VQCDLCARTLDRGRRRPVCVSCIRATLYEPRLQQALELLHRQDAHTRAEAIVRPGNDGVLAALPPDADFDAITTGIHKFNNQLVRDEQTTTSVRTSQIVEKARELEEQMKGHRQYILSCKQKLQDRRKTLAFQKQEFVRDQSTILEPIQAASKKAGHRLDRTRDKLIDARLVLCREAASACNFRRQKQVDGSSEYVLGGLSIPNLKDLHSKTQPVSKQDRHGGRTVVDPHESVSEVFDSVARLVSICAHYLQVRPPAEIILPHENFPRALVMPERSSYKMRDVPYPGLSTSTSQNSSPSASRTLEKDNQPRPRPLHLDRPLAQLMKEDLKSYGLFVEGVALLAWDVAWLCRTQGLDSVDSFEDFCSIGRNLWHLLTMQHRKQPKPPSDRRLTAVSGKDETPRTIDPTPRLGLYSHASVRFNLSSAEGSDILRDWRLSNPARLIDKLKSIMLSEISGAEWDLLEEAEW